MMMKSDFERWENENLYMYQGRGWSWDVNKPVTNALYTKDEVVEFAKNHKYYPIKDELDVDYQLIKDMDFISFDDEGSEYLESFYEEFTTPSGETIVAFGEYGYDG
jgi:hypothetical protein